MGDFPPMGAPPMPMTIPPPMPPMDLPPLENAPDMGGNDDGNWEPDRREPELRNDEPPRIPEPPLEYNDAGLPMRPGAQKCSYFLRLGNCNYGPGCRFDHPEGMGGLMAGGKGFGEFPGVGGGAAMCEGDMPRRPGRAQCSFLAKTGQCPFGPECRFDHALDQDGKPQAAPPALAVDASKPAAPEVKKKKDSGLGGTRGRRTFPGSAGATGGDRGGKGFGGFGGGFGGKGFGGFGGGGKGGMFF